MPELPEVETIRQNLNGRIIKETIDTIYFSGKTLRINFPIEKALGLSGNKIKKIERRARYLILYTNDEHVILIHLGMSGRLLFNEDQHNIQKHDHVCIYFKSKNSLTFNDPRRFGFMDIVEKQQLHQHKYLLNLGPEPLSNIFNALYLKKTLKNKNIPIKTALMNNKIVVGVGNIYANEILFYCKLHPSMLCSNLKDQDYKNLVDQTKSVLKKAIQMGGSTIKDYMHSDGTFGSFQYALNVYGLEGENCKLCQSEILKIKQNGRSTFYCSSCQKEA